jgi:ribbon-helix-helix CopG family protein
MSYAGGVKSLRLDTRLVERLQKAAAVTGETLSEFIRRAAAARADAVLFGEADDDWSDVIGAVHGGGGRARRTGEAFADLVVESQRKR